MPVSKTGVPQGTVGSNPTLSASISKSLNEFHKDAISCTGNGLRLVVSGKLKVGEDVPGLNRSQAGSAMLASKYDKNEPIEFRQSTSTIDELRQTVQAAMSLLPVL